MARGCPALLGSAIGSQAAPSYACGGNASSALAELHGSQQFRSQLAGHGQPVIPLVLPEGTAGPAADDAIQWPLIVALAFQLGLDRHGDVGRRRALGGRRPVIVIGVVAVIIVAVPVRIA